MTPRRILLPTPQVVKAGNTSTIQCKMGFRYLAIILEYCDNFASAARLPGTDGTGIGAGVAGPLMGDIRVKANQKVQRTHNAFELDSLNKSNGTQYAYQTSGAGATLKQRLCIFFAEPWRKNVVDQYRGAFNVSTDNGIQQDSFQIEVDLTALAGNTGAVNPSLVAYAIVDDVQHVDGGQMINKVYRQNVTVNGTAVDIALAVKDWYQAIFFRNPTTAGLVSKVTLKSNGITVNELPADTNGSWLTNMDTLALETITGSALAGGFGYSFIADITDPMVTALPTTAGKDSGGNPLPVNLECHVDFNVAATGNFFVISQRLGPLD